MKNAENLGLLLLIFDQFPKILVKVFDALMQFFFGSVFFAHVFVIFDELVIFLLELEHMQLYE